MSWYYCLNPLLVVDHANEHDEQAIKVLFQEKHIGWYSRKNTNKSKVYEALVSGKKVSVKCLSNYRKGKYIRAHKPDSDGNWNDKYLGMVQYFEAKFEFAK